MTPHRNVFGIKFVFTLFFMVFLVFVIVYADKFAEPKQELVVNSNFLAINDSDSPEINLDEIASVELDENNQGVIKVKVQPGDTLEKIARTFGSTVSHIKKINHITGPIRPGDTLMITDEEKGFVYVIPKKTNILVFANQYNLNVDDLMSLNYISDKQEILAEGQEIFINISEEEGYNKGLLERPAPVIITKTNASRRPTITKPQGTILTRNSNPASSEGSTSAKSRIISKRVYKSNVVNGFYAGQCTHYVAMITPSLFPYVDKNKQERKITGNASNRCESAKKNGYSVGSKPSVGAIVVYAPGGGVSYAGHVAKVISINHEEKEMVVEEANYIAKGVADRRIESIDKKNIKCYIYPEK